MLNTAPEFFLALRPVLAPALMVDGEIPLSNRKILPEGAGAVLIDLIGQPAR
jgi:hypothetical protein